MSEGESGIDRGEELGWFEAAPDAIVLLDPESGQVIDVNPRACELYGFTREEFLGMTLESPIPAAFREAGESGREGEAGERWRELEMVHYRADGREVFLEVRASRAQSAGRETILCILRDVTRRKRTEEARLARASSELAVRARQEFLAAVSYEIRTPMSSIVGISDLLLDLELPVPAPEYARIIRSSAERLVEALDDVVEFSQAEGGVLMLEQVDFRLEEALGRVVDWLRPRAESRGVEIGWQIAADVPEWLRGDPSRLRQVLIHLLGEAAERTAERRVEVEIEASKPVGDGSGAGAVALRFAIRDARLDADTMQAAVAREIVERMGGETAAGEDLEGVGFTARFGASTVSVQGSRPAGRSVDGAEAARVLLAEDDSVNRMVARHQLGSLGYRVTVVENGREALEALERGGIDLVLMDCQMPELDGYEATREIRRRELGGPGLPVIAVTAHALEGDREKCLAAGMDDYISKPYREKTLGAVLERWLDPRRPAHS